MVSAEDVLKNLGAAVETDQKLQKQITTKLNADVTFVITDKDLEYTLYGKKDQAVKLVPGGGGEIVIRIAAKDMLRLYNKKTSAQKLYMGGRLKVKGNVMKVGFIEPLLQSQNKAKL